jgi:hypothetical protein
MKKLIPIVRGPLEKRVSAIDTKTWLTNLQGWQSDDDILCTVMVLDAAIDEYTRQINKAPLTDALPLRACALVAAVMLEELHTDQSEALATWCYGEMPTSKPELVATVLNDALDAFTTTLLATEQQKMRACTVQ